MTLRRRQRLAQQPLDLPDNPLPPAGLEPPAPAKLSWPEAFLAAVIVLAGFTYHYLQVGRGTDPVLAVQYLMAIAIPLVALVLPSTVLSRTVRPVCRLLGAFFNSVGGGGAR